MVIKQTILRKEGKKWTERTGRSAGRNMLHPAAEMLQNTEKASVRARSETAKVSAAVPENRKNPKRTATIPDKELLPTGGEEEAQEEAAAGLR
jgi:hypothetical protein